MDTFVEKLNNNPIFQLSLSSKELFHSNFLAWLAEDKNTRTIFNQIMKIWMQDENWEFDDSKMMVKREYYHFDFCICKKVRNYHTDKDKEQETQAEEYIPGPIIFVLENKFKSLPYKEQLEKYHQKVLSLNVQGLKDQEKAKIFLRNEGKQKSEEKESLTLKRNWTKENIKLINSQNTETKYVLLTLVDNILDNIDKATSSNSSFTTTSTFKSGNIEITNTANWQIKNYSKYSDLLDDLNKKPEIWKDNTQKDFYQELIKKYCEFISLFSEHITTCLSKMDKNEEWNSINPNTCWSILTNQQDFNKIRCSDIWQKSVMYKCAKYLSSKISSDFVIDYNSDDKHIWEDRNETSEGKQKLFIGIGFFHGEAFLEFKYRMNDNCIFTLQQQGNNTLCVGVVVKGINKIEKKNGWNNEVIKKIGEYFPDFIEYKDKKFYAYQGRYCSFFYYHLAEEEVGNSSIEIKQKGEKRLSVTITIDKMIAIMKETIMSKNIGK